MQSKWVICPLCNSKTRLKLREDTILKNFPLFCPKCKHELLISAENFKISIIQEFNCAMTNYIYKRRY